MKTTISSILALFVLGFGLLGCELASAQTVSAPVAMTQSESGFGPVLVGDTTVDIPFTVSSYDSMIFRVIAPVDGVMLTLINPSGAVAVAANSPLIQFMAGSGLTPPKPGGIFTTVSIPTSINGVWKLRFTFPAATQKTYIFATWLGKSIYESGIIPDNNQYLTGETGLFGYLVTNNGQPITGLSPTITITPVGGQTATIQVGKDDGLTIDGKANDGLYSVAQTFTVPGKYTVVGNVSITTPSGPVLRKAETTIEVVDPLISVSSSTVTPTIDPAQGCAIGVTVGLTMNVSVAGTYIIRGDLAGSNGKTFSVGDSFTLAAGTQTVYLLFPVNLIKDNIGVASSFSVTGVQGYKIDPAAATVRAFSMSNLGSYTGALCVDAISLIPGIVVTETLQSGLLSALTFKFPVVVQADGSYTITLHIVGPNGEPIDLISLTQNLVAGSNDITFTEPGEKFSNVDGPYRIVSVIVVGNNQAASVVELGQTKTYLKSAFAGRVSTTSYTAAINTGVITASFTGGGAGCGYSTSNFIPVSGGAGSPPAGTAPAGVSFPQGLFDFATNGCDAGSTITMVITYPQVLPPGTVYWKYGPTPTDHSYHWYQLPATIVGNTVTFSITDGGLGDDDLTANGIIVDQGGPGVPAATSIPTLSEWGMIILSGLMALGALVTLRRQRM